MRHLKKFSHYYKATALMWFNICLCFILLNAVLLFFFYIKDSIQESHGYNQVTRKYGNDLLSQVYPGFDKEQVDRILDESWSRPYVYEPFTLFKESPYKGLYINVDKNGFRITADQGPWPPDSKNYNIYLLGGSTAFGYGIPDDYTVATFLQLRLEEALGQNIKVYNFGRGHYYSSQERILLQELVVRNCIPDLVIFLDGFNEFWHYEHPFYSENLKKLVAGQTPLTLDRYLIDTLPMTRLARSLTCRFNFNTKKHSSVDEPSITEVIHRYLGNKSLIEAVSVAYGFHSIFVWQPIPSYKYDREVHLFAKSDPARHAFLKKGYELMAEYVEQNDLGKNFLWCADIQENLREPLYVDQAHYSTKMCKILADTIAEFLLLDGNLSFLEGRK